MHSRVLVITSDDAIRRDVEALLARCDTEALCVATLARAQELTVASRIDAVILQAGFSGSLPGLHYVRWLRSYARRSATPVAVVIREDELEAHEVAAAEALAARVFTYRKDLTAILEHVNAAIADRRAA